MIRVNLLPQLEKQKRATQVPPFFLWALLAAIAIVACTYFFQQFRVTTAKRDIKRMEKELKEMSPKVASYQQQLKDLEQKKQAQDELTRYKFLWSKKLNALSNLLPDNMKFQQIRVENRDSEKVLHIEGVSYCRSGEERTEQIGKLITALKTPDFYNKPSGEPNFGEIQLLKATSTEEGKDMGLQVFDFAIEMVIL